MIKNQLLKPSLSICIPSYNRPIWLGRALSSILKTPLEQQAQVEIIVSDDSTTSDCKKVVEKLMMNWHGAWRYQLNSPSLGMARNWNQCIAMASMEYVLILHDDDYLDVEATANIFQALSLNPCVAAFLFGVTTVTAQEKKQKCQVFKAKTQLSPQEALGKVLENSSFIRFPGIVIKKEAFEKVGYFDESIGEIADIHMWIRICHVYGLLCIPAKIANYTIHNHALTMGMFNLNTIKDLEKIFEDVQNQRWLPLNTIKKCKANYFHQFVLAGTVRHLKRWELKKARNFIVLLHQIEIRHAEATLKWKIIKNILTFALYFKPFNIHEKSGS